MDAIIKLFRGLIMNIRIKTIDMIVQVQTFFVPLE